MKNLILFGVIVGVKGLKGEVKIKSFTSSPIDIVNYNLLDEHENPYIIESSYLHKNIVIAKIKNINTRENAENLVGLNLYVKKENLKELDTNSYYYEDLIGLKVITSNNEELGNIIAVYNFGAGDIIEYQNTNKELNMLPFDKETIIEVNITKGFVKVELLEYV